MPDQFDPYAQWLGIVEPQRPVNYYVLLGIAPSESDPQRIAQAADMQAARVRRIRPGPYLVQWSALLDEIAAAKACLTNPQARAAYDAALVGQRSAPQMVAAPSATGGAVAGPHGQSGQTAQPLTAATTSAQPQLQQAAGQAHQPAVQYQPVLSWPSAPATQQSAIATQPSPIATQPYGVPTPPPDRAFAEPATLTAGTVSPGSGLSGQFGADAPLRPQVNEQAAQVRVPFPVGYTQAPVYVTTPQPTPPPCTAPAPAQAAQMSAGAAAGVSGSGHTAAIGLATDMAGPPNQPVGLAADISAARPSVIGQSGQASPRGSGLRVVAGVLLVILIGLLCATAYELLKRNGILVSLGAPSGQQNTAATNGERDPNQANGQARSAQAGQSPGAQSGAGQSSLGSDQSNQDQTGQPEGTPGQTSTNGDGAAGDPSNPAKPTPQRPNGNNGKSSDGGNTAGKHSAADNQQQAQSQPESPQKRAAFLDAVEKTKLAMQDRDLAAARTHLKTAASNAQSDADRERLVRVETILTNLEEFWNALREAVARLPAPGELKVGDTYVAVVDNSRHGIIVRAAGQNRSYRIEEMPTWLIVAIVEHSFQKTADAKVLLGTFLAVEPGADRAAARRLLQDAARSGRNVDPILKELDLPPAASGAAAPGGADGSRDLDARLEAVLQRARSAKSSAEQRDVAVAALALLEQALKQKKLDEARQLAELALTAARASNNPTLMRQAAAAKQRLGSISDR